jgi:serine/threonine-protein kinase
MLASASSSIESGERIAGRYVVRSELGSGGMGRVLDVEHAELGRRFALKLIRLERWDDRLVERFRREARAVARVESPRVAQVTDFGVDDRYGPFYVMERVEGETLDRRIDRDGPLSPREAATLVAELADAIADVHAAGIVHRDIKPSNVALCARGPVPVKLIDFGLAAAVDEAGLSRITQSEQVVGSLPYMAPEQFQGASPDPQLDQWALGVLAYEALTGRLPYLATTTAALIHQILTSPVPTFAVSDVPGPLGAVIRRLLQKKPEDRFASAADVAAALEQLRDEPLPRPAATSSPGEDALAVPLAETMHATELVMGSATATGPAVGLSGSGADDRAPAETLDAASGVRARQMGRRRWPLLAGMLLGLGGAAAGGYAMTLGSGVSDGGAEGPAARTEAAATPTATASTKGGAAEGQGSSARLEGTTGRLAATPAPFVPQGPPTPGTEVPERNEPAQGSDPKAPPEARTGRDRATSPASATRPEDRPDRARAARRRREARAAAQRQAQRRVERRAERRVERRAERQAEGRAGSTSPPTSSQPGSSPQNNRATVSGHTGDSPEAPDSSGSQGPAWTGDIIVEPE